MDKQYQNAGTPLSGRHSGMLNKGLAPKLNRLFERVARVVRSHKHLARPSPDAFRLEQLEPRLLLSADPLASLMTTDDVTLKVVEKSSEQYIQLVDNNNNSALLGERKISDIAAGTVITVTGSSGDDTFNVDQSFLDLGERQFVVQFDGADGADTMATDGEVTDSVWQVSGDHSGSMGTNGIVEFLNTEQLTAVNSDESRHVLSAINNSFNWQITDDGNGILSTLEQVPGSAIQTASSTQIVFSGFDEIGGSGTDYLDYSQYGSEVTVDLEAETASGFDHVTGINTLIGSARADDFTGDSNNNVFVTGMGDTVNGNGGFDTVVYREQGAAGRDLRILVDKAASDFTYESGSWDGTSFVADVDNKMTAKDVDLLSARGGSGDNYFDFSLADVDVHLDGGAGDDVLLGGSKNDVLTGGLGADQLTGNAGSDEVIEVRAADFRLNTNTLKIGDDDPDTLNGIERVYLRALSANGDIAGKTLDARGADAYDITLEGTELADSLYASDHGDTLIGLGGADTMTGGSGTDTLSERFSGRADIRQAGIDYALDLAQGTTELWTIELPAITSGDGFTLAIDDATGIYATDEISWDHTGRDITRAIEKALSLSYGQLTISEIDSGWQIGFSGLYAGQKIANRLSGSNDVTAAVAQQGAAISDTLVGFDLNDIISLTGSEKADNVDLSAFVGKSVIATNGGHDTIKGAQGVNTIDGGDGNDTIYVHGSVNDQITGGKGADTLIADLSADTGTAYDFDLDNHQLQINSTLITLNGIEAAELMGADGDDSFDASDFYGVSASTDLSNLSGWSNLSEHTLRITLNDGSDTVVDIDVTTASTLEQLIALINAADDRDSGALTASFNQQNGNLELTGLTRLTTAGSDQTILGVLGLTSGAVNSPMVSGVSLSLLASLQLTSQRGNDGNDSYTGSAGNDRFIMGMGDTSVVGGDGTDTMVAATNVTHTELALDDSSLTWKGVGQDDARVTLDSIEVAELTATSGATLLDGSAASLNQILDAGETNASLKGGTGNNEFRLDIGSRTDTGTQAINVTVKDEAVNNDIVFYGGSDVFSTSDFDWVNVTGNNYAFVSESSGDLSISNEVLLTGQSVEFRAGSGTITVSADLKTDDADGTAGNITLKARHIVVADGVTISAQGDSLINSGDITLTASDSRNDIKGLGFYNFDRVSATVTINAATIRGKDITILARAESNPDTPMNHGGGVVDAAAIRLDTMKNELEQQSLIFGYARSEVDTKVTIAAGAILDGDNISVKARSIARVTSQPISAVLAAAIGSLKSTADVAMDGTIIAGGDVDLASQTNNFLKVLAEPLFGYGGYSGSVAVGLLESDSSVLVSHTGNIVADGNLNVQASSFDLSYVGAISDAENNGKLAASIAVHIEDSETVATLAGTVLVKGNVTVDASHGQGRIDGSWGTEAHATVDRVPGWLDKQKDLYKQKAASTVLASKIPFAKTALTPSNRLAPTKFTAGIALVYADDTNRVKSLIGQEGFSSDIQVGGTLDQSANVDSRLLTSVSSTSSSPSQLEQVLGSAGTSGAFQQVPFGGAVSVTIASLNNDAKAIVQGNTHINALGMITIDAKAENLTGLISSDTSFKYVKPTLINSNQINTDYAIKKGDLLRFDDSDYDWQQSFDTEKPDIGFFGAVYKYLGGDRNDMRLDKEDFSDPTQWELLGDQFTSIPNQLLGGESDIYLLDNDIKATAAGAKVSLALNFSLMDSKQTADARIKGTVEINQREALENTFDSGSEPLADTAADTLLANLSAMSDRNLSLNADTVNKSVDWVGNKTSTASYLPGLKKLYELNGASSSLNGVGASVYINKVTTESQATIEKGATIYADALSVKANTEVFAINSGYSGGSGNGTLGIAGLYMHNDLTSTAIAQVESGVDAEIGTRLMVPGSTERLTVTADNRVDLIVLAGASGSGGAIGVGASSAVSHINKTTKALIGTEGDSVTPDGSITVKGNARVEAGSDGLVIGTAVSAAWATGKVAPSGQSEPPVANSSYGISVSGAFIFNTVDSTTSAGLLSLDSFNAHKLTLKAHERSGVYAFPIAYASASAQKFALAAAGIGLRNDATFNVSAGASDITTFMLNELVVNANNDSTVVTTSLSAALSGLAETSVGASSSIALAGNVSINNVTADVDAYLNDISSLVVSGKDSDGFGVKIDARDESEIYAVALGVAYAGNGAVGVTYAENNINSDIDALISNTNLTSQTGKIRHQAISEADIVSVAFGAAVSVGTKPEFDTTVGIAVGAAVSQNLVRMNTRAKVTNGSTITLPTHDLPESRLDIKAHNETDIVAVVVAASVAVQSGSTSTTTVSFTGAGATEEDVGYGAPVGNAVYGDTEAIIAGSTINQADAANAKSDSDIGTYLTADVSGKVTATVVSASVAYAGATTGTGVSGGIGISLADNAVGGDPDNGKKANAVRALITDSDIDISGAVSTHAESSQTITSVVVAASGAIASSTSGPAGALSGVGASTHNTVKVDVTSGVSATVSGKSVLADSLSVTAKDRSTITSSVVGASIAGSYAASGSAGTLSIGVSLAENNITVNTLAIIDNVTMGSQSRRAGAITLLADSKATVTATSVAASLALTYGNSGALAFSGAGADANNTIKGSTAAYIEDSDIINTGAVTLDAKNLSEINATVAAVSVAGAASNSGALGVSIGAAITANDIGSDANRLSVQAYLKNTSVTSDGDLTIHATNEMTIEAGVGAGSAAVAASGGNSVAASGSGVNATNAVYGQTLAFIDNSSSNSRQIKAGVIDVKAVNTASTTATAGSASLALGLSSGGPGVSITVAASIAKNTISSVVDASVIGVRGGSKQILAESLAVTATDSSTIDATVVGVSLGVSVSSAVGISLSVGAAEGINNVSNRVSAHVEDIQIESRNGGVLVKAEETANITLKAEAAAIAVGGGKDIGAGLSGAGVLGDNDINNVTKAYISNATIEMVPRADYSATTQPDALTHGDLVEFSDGVYRYLGSDLDLTPDFEADGYEYDANGASVGNKHEQVNNGESFYFIDGTYRNNGSTLPLNEAIAVAAALRADAFAAQEVIDEANAGAARVQADAARQAADDAQAEADAANSAADAAIEASLNASTSDAAAKADVAAAAVAVAKAKAAIAAEKSEVAATARANADALTALASSASNAATAAASIAEDTRKAAGLSVSEVIGLKQYWALLNLAEVKASTPADDWQLTYATADYDVQDIEVAAVNHATITSTVGASSASLAAGLGAGAAAIGVTLSENTIGSGHQTRAYIDNSTLKSLNNIKVDARSVSKIDSTVYGAGVAMAGGKFAIAGAGVGINLTNNIAGTTEAYIQNTDMIAANKISINADADGQVIKANAVAASVSAAIGIGGAVSIAATDIDNTIKMTVDARLGVDDSRLLGESQYQVLAEKGIDVNSYANSVMKNINATAVTFSAGLTGASGGGVNITNLVDNRVNGAISGSGGDSGAILSGGDINLAASETTDLSVGVTNVAISASIGGALGVALIKNDVRSQISTRVKDTELEALNISVTAKADNNIKKTQAFGFAASLVAASANRADVNIGTIVEATTEAATLNAVDNLTIHANAANFARADASGGAFGAVAVGAMIADIQQGTEGAADVLVQIGDRSQLNAASVSLKAYGNDDLLPETIAASGGKYAGAGAQSYVTSHQAVVTNIGKQVAINGTTVNINSTLEQAIDASADAFSVAVAAGAGAGLTLDINSYADVNLGASTNMVNSGDSATRITAHDINVTALNRFDKSKFSDGKTLRTGSASLGSVSVLLSQTTLNNHARINLTDNVELLAVGSYDDKATIRIEAENDIKTIDSITLETVSAIGGINAATSKIDATSDSIVSLDGARIENVSGQVYITAKTDSENRASADILAVSGLSAAATGIALVDTDVSNTVNVGNSTIKAGDLYLYSGKSSKGVLNILESSANVELTSISTSANVAVPVPEAIINERNAIVLGDNADIKSMTDVTIEAREGIGGNDRAWESGLTLSISGVPYGVDIDRKGDVTSNNTFTVAESASVVAGVNNKTFLQIRPTSEVQAILDRAGVVNAQGEINLDALTQQEKELLFGVDNADGEVVVPELPADVVYVMEALTVQTINFRLTQDTVIEHNGQYYRYWPQATTEADLSQEDYNNTSRWVSMGGSLSAAEEAIYSVYSSSITEALATAMTGEFYVVKPKELDSPTLTFTNLSTVLFEQKAQVESWIRDHGTNAEAVARYQVQLAQINAKIEELGLADLVHKVDKGQVIKAADGHYYKSNINQQAILKLADYQDTELWTQTDNTSGAWLYTDTVHATSKIYNQALDILMVDLPDVYAAPGSVYVQIDGKTAADLAAQANMDNLQAREGATIQIANTSPFSLRVNDVVVQDTQRVEVVGGALKTYTPGAVQINYKDVNSLAIRGGSTIAGGSDSDTATPSTNEIIIFQDTKVSNQSYGGFTLPDIPQSMYIQGNVVNENGSAYINNRDGSIEVSRQIRAETVNIFAAGDFSLNSDAWFHTNKDPRQYINYQLMRSLVYNTGGEDRYWSLDSSDVPGLTSSINKDNSQILSMGKITLTARYLNVNGLIQSGVNTVYLTIDRYFNGGASNVDLSNKKGQAIAGISFADPNSPGGVKVPVDGYWDAARRAIIIDDIVPAGGEVVISGQVISTGNGRIVAASGYAAVKIDNNSGYELVLNDIDTRQYREGKITIIDSQQLSKDEYLFDGTSATHKSYTGQLIPADSATGEIARIDYTEISSATSGDPNAFVYEVTDGARYVWTEGQSKTKTTVRKFEKKSFNLFGDNAFGDWLVKDKSYKWETIEFTDKKPLLESESVLLPPDAESKDYTITYQQTAGDPDVYDYDRDSWTTGGGWFRKKTVHTKITVIEGLKDYYTHSLKADYDIAINFLGGNSTPDVDIESRGDITLAGTIKLPDESLLKIRSTHGSITMGDGSYALTQQADIEARGSVRVILEGNTVDRGNRIVSHRGSVYLGVVQDDNPGVGQSSSNRLYIDEISARHAVEINAGGGIYKANGGESVSIKANRMTLLALGGDVGHLTIDSARLNDSGTITVEAEGHVALTESAGNLYVNSIIAAQVDQTGSGVYGVQLTASDGYILDANDDETRASSLDTTNAQRFYAESQITNQADDTTTLYHQYWQLLRDNGTVAYQSDVEDYDRYSDIFSHLTGDELVDARAELTALNDGYDASSSYDQTYDQLALWKIEEGASPTDTSSEFKRRVLAQIEENKPIFNSILSPGMVAKLYPDTPIIGGVGSSTAEVANIQTLVSGSQVILQASGGLGKTGDKVVINMTNGINNLSDEERELLSQATGNDVVASDYDFYRYIGSDDDISQFDINYSDTSLWEGVTTIKASTNGLTMVSNGDFVEVDQDGIPVVYRYTGSVSSLELSVEDYDAGTHWQRVSTTSVAPASVLNLKNQDIVMQLNTVTIQLWDDLNLEGDIQLTTTAVQGIALEHTGDLFIDRVEGANWVRLNVRGDIIDNGGHPSAAVVSGGDLVLISKGSIQSDTGEAFRIQVADTGQLSVDATGSVNLWQVEGNVDIAGTETGISDLHLADVAAVGDITLAAGLYTPLAAKPAGDAGIVVEKISTTTGTVSLQAAGDILDAFTDTGSAIINIRAKDLQLLAEGGIGSRQSDNNNYLDIKLSGVVHAQAGADIYLNAVESHLNIGQITSGADVILRASESILDADHDNNNQIISLVGESDITARSVYLTALKGGIGQLGNQLEINTDGVNNGQLTSLSNKNTHLREVDGDLRIASVVADSDNSGKGDANVYLTVDGNLFNALATGHSIVAHDLRIVSGLNTGSSSSDNHGALRTNVDNLEVDAKAGSVSLVNSGHLTIGIRGDDLTGVQALNDINLTALSPMTINEDTVALQGNITLTATDDAHDGAVDSNDNLLINAVIVNAVQGNLTLNAGDKLLLTSNGQLNAARTMTINTDLGNSDDSAGTVELFGSLDATDIFVNTGLGNDTIVFDVNNILGDVEVKAGDGLDTITVDRLVSRSAEDSFILDGQGGTDTYTINRTGKGADYVIDVTDTGSEADGADTLTINGTGGADTFLLRANFVAALHSDGNGGYADSVERVNYDRNINARLTLNGHAGDDSFFSDDNSSITTLDGGAGNDSFQIGQLFGIDRQASEGTVAAGDEIETTETTLGFLSNGNSLPMVVYGGDGEDQVRVFSNKAVTKLYGEAGDDSFVVRAFLKKGSDQTAGGGDVELFGGDGADDIQYSINSPLKIDGGSGTDSIVVLGTEADDNFMITEDGIFGAGLNVGFDNVEIAEVDGLEGDDTFYVLSTNANVETTIIGGQGADTFNVASDVTRPIVSYSVEGRSSFVNHSVFSDDPAYSGIFVNGVPLNVANESNGAVAVDTMDGQMLVDENGLEDRYQLSFSVPQPDVATVAYITVSAARASGSDEESTGNAADSILISTDGVNFYESLVLTYDSDNWSDTTTIYVKAINDSAEEGQRDYVISHSVRSDNPDFDNLDINNVEVTVNDNDKADIIVTSVVNPKVVEGGTSETFDVRLATRPDVGETVTVSLSEVVPADWSSQLTLSDSTLTFDHTNWDRGQSFTVLATNDEAIENRYRAGITLSANSNLGSSAYNSVDSVDVSIDVIDNDKGAVIITQSDGSTLVSEAQGDSYTLVLSKQPTVPVTVNLLNDGQILFSSSDSRFDGSANTVTFDIDDWDQPITIDLGANPDYQPNTDSQPVQNPPLQPHTLTNIRGKLIIEGGVPEGKSRELSAGITLPTETDGDLPVVDSVLDESQQTDTLNVFNDGSVQDDTGLLTDTTLTGLGMPEGKGIEYHDIEVIETLLGTGNDNFTVSNTAKGAITVVHGGGGDDTLTVTGSDSDGVLILLGDSVQDGSAYNATSLQKTEKGREFNNPGNDTIDASGAEVSVVIYGGQGDDTLTGSRFGDHIAGGSGDDTVFGLGGADHIYGDAGFNVDISTRLDLSTQILTVVNTADTLNDNPETADTLTSGNDTIDGGDGNDIIFGDKGEITQETGTNRILTTGAVVSITNTNRNLGGNDIIRGNNGDDIVMGGFGNDLIRGGAGNDSLFGDSGLLNYLQDGADGDNDISTLDSLFTVEAELGGDDTIYGNAGDDRIFGGAGSDTLYGGNSVAGVAITDSDKDILLGDLGGILLSGNRAVRIYTTNTTTGKKDTIEGNEDDDIILAGAGDDNVSGNAGDDWILGDFGEVDLSDNAKVLTTTTGDTHDTGDDVIDAGEGNNRILGGLGKDTITSGAGDDHIAGDNATLTYSGEGVIVSAESIDLSLGDADTIDSGAGNDLILGGFGGDTITSGAGDDTVIGDNGRVNFLDGIRSEVFSTDTTDATGGDDIIALGSGEDQLIAGVGADTVTNESGESIIIGDDGRIESDAAGRYLVAVTGNTGIGGNDTVTGGSDRDIIFGGFGADTLDGQAGDDLIGGDGTRVTRNTDTIVMEATDLFTGGNDTLIGGTGLDRMQGHFGGDLFYGSFSEDVMVGEYARFTFDSSTDTESATSVISLAQGDLDLIRQTQTGLINGFAQSVFAESNLGQAAQSRTAITTAFTVDALNAFGRLGDSSLQTGSNTGQGVDILIPTAPVDVEAEETEITDDGSEIPPEEGDENIDPEKACEAPVEGEAVTTHNGCEGQVTEEPFTEEPFTEEAPGQQTDDKADDENNNDTDERAESGIDLKAALAGFAGWAVMKSSRTGSGTKKRVA